MDLRLSRGPLGRGLAVFLIAIFFVTGADAASIVMGMLSQGGEEEPDAPALADTDDLTDGARERPGGRRAVDAADAVVPSVHHVEGSVGPADDGGGVVEARLQPLRAVVEARADAEDDAQQQGRHEEEAEPDRGRGHAGGVRAGHGRHQGPPEEDRNGRPENESRGERRQRHLEGRAE